MNASGYPLRPAYERINWTLLYIVVLFVSAVIAGVWSAYDYPNWTGAVSATDVVIIVVAILLCVLFSGLGILAHVLAHTPVLMLAGRCFRIARWGEQPLPPISSMVTEEDVKNLGLKLPPEVVKKAIASGKREFSAAYVKLGGLIIEGFFLRPKDYYLIFFPGDIWHAGDKRVGEAYFSEKTIRSVNHQFLPESWAEAFRADPDFKPGRSTILITGDPPYSWAKHLRENADRVRELLGDAQESAVTGGATREGLMMAWLSSVGEVNQLKRDNQRLQNWNSHLIRDGEASAERRATMRGGRMDLPPNFDGATDRPADYSR